MKNDARWSRGHRYIGRNSARVVASGNTGGREYSTQGMFYQCHISCIGASLARTSALLYQTSALPCPQDASDSTHSVSCCMDTGHALQCTILGAIPDVAVYPVRVSCGTYPGFSEPGRDKSYFDTFLNVKREFSSGLEILFGFTPHFDQPAGIIANNPKWYGLVPLFFIDKYLPLIIHQII